MPTLRSTAHIVGRITDAQWSAPTPCDDWKVRDVLNHAVGACGSSPPS